MRRMEKIQQLREWEERGSASCTSPWIVTTSPWFTPSCDLAEHTQRSISPCPCPRLPSWCIRGAAKALEPLPQKASQVDRLLKENRKVYFPQNISITPGASQHNIWNCQGTIQNYLTYRWQGKSIQVKDRYKLWRDPDVVIIRKTLKQLL